MKILVTGTYGQLGHDVCKVLSERGIGYIGTDIEDFDITDPSATACFIAEHTPDAVIHCSAWTAVDAAEDEPDQAAAVNANGARNVALACKAIGAKMLYISTDYVFPGEGENFYRPDDPTGPLNVYGKTKLQGEQWVSDLLERYFIVRTSWLFGANGNNFVKTILRRSQTKNELNVVCDQIGSPTYAADLAPLLCDMILTEKYGIYHATNEGVCSWAEFAQRIFFLTGKQVKVHPIPSAEYPAKAARPLNSRLCKDNLVEAGFQSLPDWSDALERYLKEIEGELL